MAYFQVLVSENFNQRSYLLAFTLRQFPPDSNFLDTLSFDALERVVPLSQIEQVLTQHQAHQIRTKKLNMTLIVFLLIAANVYTDRSFPHVLEKLVHGTRLFGPDPNYGLPGANAICYRRYQLGAKPLVSLFHQICRPLATIATPGAFLFGLRLMALDGTSEEVADTPTNAKAFGKHRNQRSEAAFPQIKAVYLTECGTHAIIDAGVWPVHTSERVGGFRLLRSITPEMLLMWDRGFHDYQMFCAVIRRGAQVLARLPSHVQVEPIQFLPDGSYLARLYCPDKLPGQARQFLIVRIVEYTVNDPALVGYGERHRLITTLLNFEEAPALELAWAYHERWEIEMTIDEIDTHQRLVSQPLRSQKPVGVVQEFYSLLLAHYVIRYLMHEAAVVAKVAPTRLSFKHTLLVVAEAVTDFQIVAPAQHQSLYQRMLVEIGRVKLPQRRARSNPRVVKRKMSKFERKRERHYSLPPLKVSFRQAIMLI